MSKRKLTRKQKWRIEKIQSEKIRRAEKRESTENSSLSNESHGPEESGLVIARYGARIDVEPEGSRGESFSCHLRSNLPDIVTGDKVIWQRGENHSGVVVACLPRRSQLSRPDNYGQLRTVAANIDHIFVVISPLPSFHSELVDRYLVAAEVMKIEPVIVLNKVDLLDDEKRKSIRSTLSFYEHAEYSVLEVSANTGEGMSGLEKRLSECSCVFVGQSGVGKSSLVNRLLPCADAKVGTLSNVAGKGRHTTTASRLFHLSCGGTLIDSPGIRRFGLWHMTPGQVYGGFREFAPFMGQCRFANCSHTAEPGCAFLEALKEGKIMESRWSSCKSIIGSL